MTEQAPDWVSDFVAKSFNVDQAFVGTCLQELWSGYGKIIRYSVNSEHVSSAIVKWINPQDKVEHPRGWNTHTSHQRKLKSYQVETAWYQNFAKFCDETCRIPQYYASQLNENETILVIEDLDAQGYNLRHNIIEEKDIDNCIRWLAAFHAKFIHANAEQLWQVGSYWHFATRNDEWQAMPDGDLKTYAGAIDTALNSATFKTIIHGDAKVANFCFRENKNNVAAVDFQYVGAGVGVKDLMYFLGGCLDSEALFEFHNEYLDKYFSYLKQFSSDTVSDTEFKALEQEWRSLYSIAIADFSRFLIGWKSNHWKLNAYTQFHVQQAISLLRNEEQE